MEYRTAICRLCLVTDDQMFAIGGTPLQIVYEKLTNIQFLDDIKPVVACQICHAQLKKSWKLMVTSLKADNVFTDYLKNNTMDLKTFSLIDRRAYSLAYPLVSTLVELTDRPPEEYKLEVKKESEQISFFPSLSETVVLIDNKTDVSVPNVDLEFMKEEVEWLPETTIDTDKPDSDSDDDIPVKALARRQSAKRTQSKRQPAKRSAKRQPAKRQTAKRQPKPKEVTFIEPPKEEELKDEENKEVKDDEEQELRDAGLEEDEDDSDYEPPPVTDGEGEEEMKLDERTRKHIQRTPVSNIEPLEEPTTAAKRLKSLESVVLPDIGRRYVCGFCQKVCIERKMMQFHLKDHKPYECIICNVTCINKSLFRRHRLNHSIIKRHQCDVCGVRFQRISTLKAHLVTHTDEKAYECEICHYKFNARGNWMRHLTKHTGEKRFECNICHRRFREKYTLSIHILSHTGEKPYQCSVCGLAFQSQGFLNRHFDKKHSGLTPYECDVCQRKFAVKTDLRLHRKNHNKTHECNICNRKFTHNANLQYHLRKHNELKCEVCQCIFKSKRNLDIHLKTHSCGVGRITESKSDDCQRTVSKKKTSKVYLIKTNVG